MAVSEDFDLLYAQKGISDPFLIIAATWQSLIGNFWRSFNSLTNWRVLVGSWEECRVSVLRSVACSSVLVQGQTCSIGLSSSLKDICVVFICKSFQCSEMSFWHVILSKQFVTTVNALKIITKPCDNRRLANVCLHD